MFLISHIQNALCCLFPLYDFRFWHKKVSSGNGKQFQRALQHRSRILWETVAVSGQEDWLADLGPAGNAQISESFPWCRLQHKKTLNSYVPSRVRTETRQMIELTPPGFWKLRRGYLVAHLKYYHFLLLILHLLPVFLLQSLTSLFF